MRAGIIALVLLTVAAAPAASAPKFYASAQIGFNGTRDSTLDNANGTTTELDLGTGVDVAAAVGMYFDRNIRFEVEYAFGSGDVERFLDGGGINGGTGDMDASTFMANAFYDIGIGHPKLMPYVGAGIGLAKVSLDNAVRGNTFFADDSDLAFAWQLGVGMGYAFKPMIHFTADLRYLATTELTFRNASNAAFDADYARFLFRVGARFSF